MIRPSDVVGQDFLMEKLMTTRTWAMLALSVFVAACGTTEPSPREASEVAAGKKALVRTFNQPLLASMILGEEPVTQIVAVDGRKFDSAVLKLDEAVAMEVGTREVDLRCVRRSGHDERDYGRTLRLELKPHHEYLIRCSFDTDFGPNGTYTGSFSVKELKLR